MKKETRGIKAYIDIFDVLGYHPIHGVPLGGIGSGTVTRGHCHKMLFRQVVSGWDDSVI